MPYKPLTKQELRRRVRVDVGPRKWRVPREGLWEHIAHVEHELDYYRRKLAEVQQLNGVQEGELEARQQEISLLKTQVSSASVLKFENESLTRELGVLHERFHLVKRLVNALHD